MKSFCVSFFLFFMIINLSAQEKKKFAIKSSDDLIEYLDNHSVEYKELDLASLKDMDTFLNYIENELFYVPAAFFFNKEGYRVSRKYRGDRCSQIITKPEKINIAKYEKDEHISEWLNDFSPLLSEEVIDESVEYDAYIIIFWAAFLDEESNQTSFNWYKSIIENTEMKIKPILVSLDLQAHWQLSDMHKKAFKLE